MGFFRERDFKEEVPLLTVVIWTLRVKHVFVWEVAKNHRNQFDSHRVADPHVLDRKFVEQQKELAIFSPLGAPIEKLQKHPALNYQSCCTNNVDFL